MIDTDINRCIHVLFGLTRKRWESLNDYLWVDARSMMRHDVTPTLKIGSGGVAVMGGIHLIPSSIKAGRSLEYSVKATTWGMLNDGFGS